ncbi:GntR family transcriptional regulator [Bacillus cereus group sp. N6]|uniref:GntR family transcriptional regulator n=1 Tax=Bacillus cereus group sp. N6 TaxID=2794583 RepID=UPI0018F442E9|nr:GntR family transcriptional regulator [Bacillus cereus group sp. N6]MBJ8113569.1 GntR family transcriptional regulator [Bacillus cereus group sp. N6]
MHQKSREQQAYEYIKYAILTGELSKGDLLHQHHLAIQFGMSRTPIRQALSRLSGEGYVTSYGKSGTFVSYKNPLSIQKS